MASIELTARRTVFAAAIAIAALAAPAVAAYAGSPVVSAPSIVAEDSPGCTTTGMPGDPSLDCAPPEIPNIGAPSEEELTAANPGVNSPARGHR